MADKFEGDIIPFKKKGNIIPNDLTPDDLINNNNKCDIIGEIVPYKKPAGAPPEAPPEAEVPPEADISAVVNILEEHRVMLQQIVKIEEDLKNFLMGYSVTGTYFEIRTSTTVATPDQPATPDTLANPNVFPPIPGYDFIDINKQKQGQNAQKLWIINDGPAVPVAGDNLFVITSSDGKTFSPEFLMIVGETRLINNVYEIRIRSPHSGNVVRITEREAMVPYVTTVTNTLNPIGNRASLTARRIGPLNVPQFLPNIAVPDTFSLVIRAWVDNSANSKVYVAGPDPGPFPATVNTTDATKRITLAPGDVVKYTVSNAILIAVFGSLGTEYVDITVEL